MKERRKNTKNYLRNIPDDLIISVVLSMLGEIYNSIRAVAIGYDEDAGVTLLFYFDKLPTDSDLEYVNIIGDNLENIVSNDYGSIDIQCRFSDKYLKDLDSLCGFIYARREWTDNSEQPVR